MNNNSITNRKGFEVRFRKSCNSRLWCVCKTENCGFFIHCRFSKLAQSWKVQSLDFDHCDECLVNRSRKISSSISEEEIKHIVIENEDKAPIEILNQVKDVSARIEYHPLWRAIQRVKKGHCDFKKDLNLLESYGHLLEKNSGSYFVLDNEEGVFKRVFMALNATITMYQYSSHMIFLDGTFLTSKYRGILLLASTFDSNNNSFIVASAIVPSENEEDWTWFLRNLSNFFGDAKNYLNFTFMSDREKGIISSVEEIFPNSAHLFCFKHIERNILSRFPGMDSQFKALIWQASNALTEAKFNQIIDLIGQHNPS